jgi:hypothetical protein
MGLTEDPKEARESGIDPVTGMQNKYVVLSEEERSKGFVRPLRKAYVHIPCGSVTWINQAIAETYAANPKYYSGTYCAGCRDHFPVGESGEFVWDGTDQKVGS